MAHDVFISHSAKDKATADAVCARLESEGIRCWIAPRDVVPGMEWSKCIIEAIRGARIMVLVFTANANASPQIRREVERAVHRNVIILPFRVENIVPDESLEYFIGNVHWLDALTPPLEAHLSNLARTVKALVTPTHEEEKPSRTEAAAPQPVVAAEPKAGGGHAAGGISPHFRFWGVQAWTWAGGAVSALLLAAVFVVVHSTSRPVASGSTSSPVVSETAPPQTVWQPAPTTGGSGPAESSAGPATEPPRQARTGSAPTSTASRTSQPSSNTAPVPTPANPPAQAAPGSDLESVALQARDLVEAKRYSEALPLAQRACNGGIMNGCNILGMIYGNGWGVARNLALARSLYQTACTGGEVSGCGNLGYLYVRGLGVPPDVAKGTALLQEACNAGRTWSCQQLQTLRR
jgi:hypothetical protein